jgi:TolB-like protein/Flp pilus assembly protein TadD
MAVIHSILNSDYERATTLRADLPREVDDCLCRMLAKNTERRYQGAAEIPDDLLTVLGATDSDSQTRSVSPAARRQPSVAVLPFADMSFQQDQAYFCDGMAEEIIGALSKLEGLKVASRTSAFRFRGEEHDVRDIGAKLGVSNVLEGSVRKAGDRLRITVQLISVEDGCHLWSEKYDRDMEDIFAIQDEISLAVVDNLRVKLLGDDRARLLQRRTTDVEAYSLYLKGRHFWNKRTGTDARKAIECFEQAIERDQGFAAAYVGLADAWITLSEYGDLAPAEGFPKAREALEQALRLDDQLGEAYATLGTIKMSVEWDWDGAERAYRKAIELSPGYAIAHLWYAWSLMDMMRFDEAIEEAHKALQLDPLSLVAGRNTGMILLYAGRYGEAVEILEKTLEIDPGFSGLHMGLGWAHLLQSRYPEALAEFEKEGALSGWPDASVLASRAIAHAKSGETGKAEEILTELLDRSQTGYVSHYMIAGLCFELGKLDLGFEQLEKAYRDRDWQMSEIKVDKMLDRVRSDSRFVELLRRLRLD